MRLVKSNAVLLQQGNGFDDMLKHIELCGRTCYKSEDKITDTSAKLFVENLIKRGHTAMLEHGTLYLTIPADNVNFYGYKEKYENNPYSLVNYFIDAITRSYLIKDTPLYITTNYRVIMENKWEDDLQFITAPDIYHAKRYTFKLTTDRGVSHELVRHRVFSFAQESTRYCNYGKDKFGNQLTFICPSWLNLNLGEYEIETTDIGLQILGDGYIKDYLDKDKDATFLRSCLDSETDYLSLIDEGCSPQEARQVLPNALKTEICMTGFEEDWKRFFGLRYFENTGKVHPDMKELTTKMVKECENKSILDIIKAY